MKSTKVLAVLAGTALLAACSQEELVESNNIPQQMEEIVGAKLIGTDISMEVSMNGSSAQSRYAGGESGWGNEDVIGFGWIVSGNASDTQSPNNKPTSALWANHMFGTEDGGTTWSTKGNLYEGWYYAYYPWSYEKKAGNIKTYTMNPAMIARGANKHYSQSLYLSNRQFVTEGDIDKENNSMSDNIKLYQAVKFIQITAKAENESAFSKDGGLDNLQIDKVTISAGDKEIFAEEVYVYGKELPVKVKYSEDMTKTETDNLNLANFRQNYSSIVPVKKAATTISRDVKAAELLVSTNPTSEGKNVNVYLNVRPTTNNTLTADDITVTFHSGAASFVISKAKGLSDINKEAIDALVAAYHKDGKLSTINELDEEGNPKATLAHLPLTFELCAADFVTDFSSITDITEWNEAVELVSLLKREQETFYIDGNIEFDGAINMPEGCELTVIPVDNEDVDETEILTDNMITLKGTFENGIPANLDIDAVDVVVEGTVEEAQTINAKSIVNKGTLEVADGNKDNVMTLGNDVCPVTNLGTIELHKYAKVTNVDNAAGRINVIYGSFVELQADDKAGEIAYKVKEADVKKPSRIQNVINTEDNSADRYALVNILVFDTENGIADFDFTLAKSAVDSDEDPYNPTEGSDADTYTFDGIEKVSLEINGVNVKSSTKPVCVKNVTIKNADLGEGVAVDGDLNIEGGNVNVTTDHINGALNITAGQGTITSETIASVNIESGNFTVNAETIEGNVEATGENYFNVETIKGDVVLTNNSANVTHIEGATIEGDVTLNGNFDLRGVTIKGNLIINKGTVKANNINIEQTLTVKAGAEFVISGNDAKITHIDNYGTLTVNVNVYTETVEIFKGSKAVVAENKTIWYNTPSYGEYGYTQEGLTNGSILYRNLAYIKNAEELAAVLTSNTQKIDVLLTEDIDLPIASLGSQTGGSGEYKLGGEATETININLNGNKLNITTTYWSAIGAKNDDATITIKNGTMTSSQATGTWNSYDVTFANCNYVIENVIFDKAVAFTNANKSVEMNKVVINETHDYYAIWISAKGQNVKIDGLTVNSDGRGIKIDEEYVDTPEKVTLNVLNASFRTNKKAAIMVKSAAGADIILSNINISGVQADKVNAVWVDEDSANYSDLVSVNGGTKINE